MVLDCCDHNDEGQENLVHSDEERENLVHSGEEQDCLDHSKVCEVNWGRRDMGLVYLDHTEWLLDECSDTGDNQSRVVERMG